MRGSIGQPSPLAMKSARRAAGLVYLFVYLAFGIALPLVFLTGNHSKASKQIGGLKLTASEKRGRELFGQHCGVCHTLSAANAVGQVGPNLDQLQPSESLVLKTIQNGCLQNPRPSQPSQTCLGYGTMPSSILLGNQATAVAVRRAHRGQGVARGGGKRGFCAARRPAPVSASHRAWPGGQKGQQLAE